MPGKTSRQDGASLAPGATAPSMTTPGMTALGAATLGAAVLGAATLLCPTSARAQLLDQYLPNNYYSRFSLEAFPENVRPEDMDVTQRPRPEVQPLGVRLGAFTLRPSLGESMGVDTNPMGTKRGDTIGTFSTDAGLDLRSNWARNSLYASAGVDDRRVTGRNAETPDPSRTNFSTTVGGSYDIGRDTLSASASYFRLHEEATAFDAQTVAEPRAFNAYDLRAAYRAAFSNVSITPDLIFRAFRFVDAFDGNSTFNQKLRDRNVYDGGVTARYAVAPRRDLVAVVRGGRSDYVNYDPNYGKLGSNTVLALAGFDDSSGAVFRYRALVGYQVRFFDATGAKNRSSPVFEAAVAWSPTRLTTISGLASRRIEDTSTDTLQGYTYNQAQIALDHELLRNVLIGARADYLHAKYTGGGDSTVIGTGAYATWLVNRNISLRLSYDFTNRDGSDSGSNYDRHLALLRVGFGL
ncbi:Hypothetical protein RMHFA_00689b [Roseomonas mucosa]|uniref:outer membrane beta-barrel protein n=1 Tax=Roseomonas TaxID=125216 RepID=UPI00125F88F0|nr:MULTISPECIES: outer membrane beta-barrel protein [Roseomonas]UZO95688.1 Hypothetical protein RMHFA_00689b [Roseomonas mucosa]